jgi:hypothetical protein
LIGKLKIDIKKDDEGIAGIKRSKGEEKLKLEYK